MPYMHDDGEELNLSVAAQYLICDLANGCTARRSRPTPMWIVMPTSGRANTMTKGQVQDYAMQELAGMNLALILGSAPPQECSLTEYGLSYYEHHLKSYYERHGKKSN